MSVRQLNGALPPRLVGPGMLAQDLGAAQHGALPGRIMAETILGLLEAAGRAIERDRDEALRCISQATSLTQHWRRQASAVPDAGSGGLAPWQLRQVTELIELKLAQTIRIPDLALSLRLSISHFSHAFRRSTGETPHGYIMRRRVERAQDMMAKTRAPLCEIALECGLSDQPHLTRVFRRIAGTSPAAWRRGHSLVHIIGA